MPCDIECYMIEISVCEVRRYNGETHITNTPPTTPNATPAIYIKYYNEIGFMYFALIEDVLYAIRVPKELIHGYFAGRAMTLFVRCAAPEHGKKKVLMIIGDRLRDL